MYLIWISLCRTHSAPWAVCGNTPATCTKPHCKHQWHWARSWRNCCSSAVRWHYVPGIYWITINKCWKYGDLNTFWNQSYGTWKGLRQILIHYDIMKLHSLARLNFSLVECYQGRANAGPEAGLRRGFHDCGTLLPVSATKGQAVTDRDITV